MISKSPKDLFKTVSQNLAKQNHEVDEDVVRLFHLFLFGKINKMMQSLEHLEIYVPKLGSWKARKLKMLDTQRRIGNKENVVRALLASQGEEISEAGVKTYLERMAKLQELINKHDVMLEDRKKFKENRDGLKADKGIIQEPQQDLGRIEEQPV